MLTVEKLIQELQELPPDVQVYHSVAEAQRKHVEGLWVSLEWVKTAERR